MFHWLKYNLKHRMFDKKNVIKIRSLPNQYYDTDERLIHGMMQLLVDFIEVECAWMEYNSFPEESKKCLSWWQRFRISTSDWFRSRKLGLQYMERQCEDDGWEAWPEGNPNKEGLRHLISVYCWWKDIRPHREDPYDASGFSAFVDTHLRDSNNYFLFEKELSPELKEEEHNILDECHRIEQAQEDEDTDNLISLIKFRRYLWT